MKWGWRSSRAGALVGGLTCPRVMYANSDAVNRRPPTGALWLVQVGEPTRGWDTARSHGGIVGRRPRGQLCGEEDLSCNSVIQQQCHDRACSAS